MTSNTAVPMADAQAEPPAVREEEMVASPTELAIAANALPAVALLADVVVAPKLAVSKPAVAKSSSQGLVNRRSQAEALARRRGFDRSSKLAVARLAVARLAVARLAVARLAVARLAVARLRSILAPTEAPEQPRAELPRRLTVALRLAFSLALLVVLFKAVSWQSVLSTLRYTNLAVALLGFAVGACGVAVSCLQWQSLLTANGIFIHFARLVKLYLIGIAFNHFLPTSMGGDAVKALYVGRDSRNHAASANAVVMTRVTGFLGMMLVAVPGILLLLGAHYRVALVFALFTVLVSGMIAAAFYAATSMDRPERSRFGGSFSVKKAIKFARALRTSSRARAVWVATAFGIYFWITGCLNYAAFGVALGLNVPLYFYFVAIPLSSLVTFLPISLGGYGVREAALTFAFTSMGVAAPAALALALLVDVQTLLFAVVGGILYLLMTRRTPRVQLSPPLRVGRVSMW